ncbi:MAG: hypothetical protein ACKO0N_07925, partial [Planctomycetota bacterium]
ALPIELQPRKVLVIVDLELMTLSLPQKTVKARGISGAEDWGCGVPSGQLPLFFGPNMARNFSCKNLASRIGRRRLRGQAELIQ